VIAHRLSLDEAPRAYKTFRDKQEQCIRVVLDPLRGKLPRLGEGFALSQRLSSRADLGFES
jgi:hypothetical protein